ncbi:hypothetical protein EV175_006094 [Coemansia sp. RSA 1933]|nr:hypothetical protein EV175_006094 [Coemansia sp. RSA 1933]
MPPNAPSGCKPIAQISAVCHDMNYNTDPAAYRHPDVLVAAVSEAVMDKIRPTRVSSRCLSSVRALACSMVYEPCSGDSKGVLRVHGASNSLPLHFSDMLNQVSSACGIHVEDLSDRIIGSVNERVVPSELANHRSSFVQGVADIGSFAAFVIILAWFGWWFAKQMKDTVDTAVASFIPNAAEAAQQIPETSCIEIPSKCSEKDGLVFVI